MKCRQRLSTTIKRDTQKIPFLLLLLWELKNLMTRFCSLQSLNSMAISHSQNISTSMILKGCNFSSWAQNSVFSLCVIYYHWNCPLILGLFNLTLQNSVKHQLVSIGHWTGTGEHKRQLKELSAWIRWAHSSFKHKQIIVCQLYPNK